MTTDLTRYVNLRYGVDNEGNTVIGPQRPNASANPAPDTKGGQHSGYFTGNDIRGFSQIHASGTGIAAQTIFVGKAAVRTHFKSNPFFDHRFR